MNNKITKFIIILLMLALSGCTGSKNIQDLTYIVAIGLDYDETKDEYTAYIQGLNFANVAKQEGSSSTDPIPTFVGSAKGKTLNMAVSNLYKVSRPPLFFGHTKTLVLSKNLLKYKFKEVLEDVGRNRSLRPSLELFVTDTNIEDIFSAKGLFDYPPVYTVLLTEEKSEGIENDIDSTSLMHFLREYYEPMGTALIPNITIDRQSWHSDGEVASLYLDGYSVFQDETFKGEISASDSMTVDWLQNKKNSLDYALYEEGELLSTFKLTADEPKVKYHEDHANFPEFSLEISVEAELLEKINDVPFKELHAKLQKSLEEKITKVYQLGFEKKMDLFDVGGRWYRSHPDKFHELENSGDGFYLSDSSLKKVKVKVEIKHFNAYRYIKETR
ncbi:Ger(x)C family spore germination protein [Rossellomorea sp. KS-H15a]|uniref:Ger(x)C family spore germination protein n=1 Tax=Rossellomorea sp. KS-H15a TaxID=2963940 RepID=UPI0020C67710|nr:Ger(x)C family spore germination protein [Rossellomorea sp. KS-H15a]UTE75544.1 Ger(x)C family spore germination protein [Rossellomorea sp. KS-H15a]